MDHELWFYEGEDGQCQVRDYLRAQSRQVRGEAGWLLERLEREGNALERPVTDYLDDGRAKRARADWLARQEDLDED